MLRSILTGILLVIFLHSLAACVTVSSDKRSGEEKARDYVTLGAEYFRHGRLEPALINLKKAIRYDSDSYAANALLALVYEQMGRFDEARDYFVEAVDLVVADSHEFGSIHNNYASFLCGQGEIKKAIKHFRLAFEHPLYQTPEFALENGGLCLYRHNDLVGAEGYFRQALRKRQNLPRSLLPMAEISFKSENYVSARAFLQRYLATVKPGAAELLLAAQIEHRLGDEVSVRKYARLLRERFPEAVEVKKLAELQ